MKRKDWKTKKSIKNIYDNKEIKKHFTITPINYSLFFSKRFKKKKEKIFFLRKLFLRKNLVLFRKNRLHHFHFFWNMHKFFCYKKKLSFNRIYNLNYLNYLTVYPDFFSKKQLLLGSITFKSIMVEKNLSFFLNNHRSMGNNIVVYNNCKDYNANIYIKLKEDFEKEDNKRYVVSLKNNNNNLTNFCSIDSFSFFFSYNLNLNFSLEIYKIIILMYILKLK